MKWLLILTATLEAGLLFLVPGVSHGDATTATEIRPNTPLSIEIGAGWLGSPDYFNGARLSGRAVYEAGDVFYYAPTGTFGWIDQHPEFGTAQTFSAGMVGGLDLGRHGFWGVNLDLGFSAFGISNREEMAYFGPAFSTSAALRVGYVKTIHVKFFGETTYLLARHVEERPFHYAGASLGFPW